MIVGHYAAALALNSVEYVRLWLKADMAAPEIDVRFAPYSVAKLFCGRRNVIIESE